MRTAHAPAPPVRRPDAGLPALRSVTPIDVNQHDRFVVTRRHLGRPDGVDRYEFTLADAEAHG